MPTWKDSVVANVVPPVRAALVAAQLPFLAVDFDFTNGRVRVCVQPNTPKAILDQVETVARGVARYAYAKRPPTYAFSLHLVGPMHPVRVPGLRDRIMEVTLRSDCLADLRIAYSELERRCRDADVAATFAQGGIVALQFITRGFRQSFVGDDEQYLDETQRRFHLFPGLLWTDDRANAALFATWLGVQPAGTRLVIFDTTFSGNAIGRIRNVVAEWAAAHAGAGPASIDIVGVVDRERLGDKGLADGEETVTSPSGYSVRVRWSYLLVTSLITEDQNNLIGYETLRPLGEIEAAWTAAVIEVRAPDGVLLDVMATRTLPALISDVLDGRYRTTALDPDTGVEVAAAGVLACIRMAADKEREQLQDALANGFIDEGTAVQALEQVNSAEEGALKRYSAYFDRLENIE